MNNYGMESTSPASKNRNLEDSVVDIPEPTIVKNFEHKEIKFTVTYQNIEHVKKKQKLSDTSETELDTVNQNTNCNQSTVQTNLPVNISHRARSEQPPAEPIASTSKAFDSIPTASTSKKQFDLENQDIVCNNNDLYGPDVGPKWYNVKGNLVTPPIIPSNLPKIYKNLPIFSKPEAKEDKEEFATKKIREFVGFNLNDEQFEAVSNYCSPEHLRTGNELVMSTPLPTLSVLSVFDQKEYDQHPSELCIVAKHQLRLLKDPANNYQKRMKYRGIRLISLPQEPAASESDSDDSDSDSDDEEEVELEDDQAEPRDLEPGKDILYRVRMYRPFPYNIKEKHVSSRHSIFSRDLVLLGRTRLSTLRDRMTCPNDAGLRVDSAANPHEQPETSAKEMFPSGFLFINNVFYVDERGNCIDRSAKLREWASARGMGEFPKRELHATWLDQITVRLGHPDVYVHQGNCEHLFTFSEIRLLSMFDPLISSLYPCVTAVSQNQSVYCTTCAEFGAKWVIVGCATVPFNPAYFCETCLKLFLYIKDKPIGDFMCYAYRGNEMNMLKQTE